MWGEKQVRNTKDSLNKDFLGIGEIRGYGYFNDKKFIENILIEYDK